MWRFVATWVAVGVVLTGATQLRAAGGAIGPGELLLVLWIAFVAFCLLRGVRFAYTDAFKVFLTFWLVSAVLMLLGSIVALQINKLADESAGHDTQAFIFVGVLTCLMGIRLGNDDKYYLSMARATLFATSAAALALLAAGLVTTDLGPVSFWYSAQRFRGWSENPNQLANFMLPMPFLGWHLLQQTRGPLPKLIHLLAILPCAAVGVATGSDALRVAWVGALGAIIAMLWFRAVFRGRSRFLHISHLILPLAAIALAIAAGLEIVERVDQVAQGVYEKQGQGEKRFTIWSHGIDAILHSPLVGLGPGAHSGFNHAFQGLEAHNSLIDWGTSTGLTGVVLLLALSTWCVWRALQAHAFALLGVALAVIIDSLFGYSLRSPIYWLLLVLVATLTEARAGVPLSTEQADTIATDPGRQLRHSPLAQVPAKAEQDRNRR